jgi:hypothetical protein
MDHNQTFVFVAYALGVWNNNFQEKHSDGIRDINEE